MSTSPIATHTILLVDDDAAILAALQRTLRRADARILTADTVKVRQSTADWIAKTYITDEHRAKARAWLLKEQGSAT